MASFLLRKMPSAYWGDGCLLCDWLSAVMEHTTMVRKCGRWCRTHFARRSFCLLLTNVYWLLCVIEGISLPLPGSSRLDMLNEASLWFYAFVPLPAMAADTAICLFVCFKASQLPLLGSSEMGEKKRQFHGFSSLSATAACTIEQFKAS